MTLDHAVLVQAVISGLLLWCAGQNRLSCYRWGFMLWACASGFMVWRRVTARSDLYLAMDRVVLPTIITYVMLASTVCFVAQHVARRAREELEAMPPGHGRSPAAIAPFILFSIVLGIDFLPAQEAPLWDGRGVQLLSVDQLRNIALYGESPRAAYEQLRSDVDAHIDTLRIAAMGSDSNAAAAQRKLDAIVGRLQTLQIELESHKPEKPR
jgi:hypothetical protein